MGKVTDELLTLITKQVQDHGIVVWYDPEGTYGEVVENLSLPETSILKFHDSFFELRHRLEPYLEFVDEDGAFRPGLETPPRVLVYVPCNRTETRYALIEVESAGVVMQPGGNPWQRNTRLKVLAERVFKRIAPDRAAEIAAEVEAGRRNLAELDWLADQSGDFGAVKLIFGTTVLADVLLGFVSSDEHDEAMQEKEALAELCQLFEVELGLTVKQDQPVTQARSELCRLLLLAELAIRLELDGHHRPSLENVPRPGAARQRDQLLAVCNQWRNRLDLRDSFTRLANEVETEAQVMGLGLQGPMLSAIETFSCLESILFDFVEGLILAGDSAQAAEISKHRRTSFWSLNRPDFQLRWTLLEIASSLLLCARRIEEEITTVKESPSTLIDAYVNGIASSEADPLPWCAMDRHHRHLEHRYAMLEFESAGSHDQLEAVVRHVRDQYFEVGHLCADVLARAFESSGFEPEGVHRQSEVFRSHVRQRCDDHTTAYLLVDALRFEMGVELVDGLGEEFDVVLTPVLVQLPSITEVGMAALMPESETGMDLVDVGSGRVGIQIGDTLLKDRASRVKHFKEKIDGTIVVLKLNDLMKPSKRRREEIQSADVLLVTSQEIDRRGEETSDEEEARLFMDEVLEKVRRGIRRLASLGVKEIVVAADHGHVFVHDLPDSMKMEPPGGETIDSHPRVWIGQGGAARDEYLRTTTARLGLGGNLELVFPRGLACLRVRGSGGGYFHGGISLQELIAPIAAISVQKAPVQDMGTTSVVLTLGKPKITTRFFSVEAKYIVAGLFGEDSKRVKVVARANRKEVGSAAMAAYGFEEGTQEIVLEKERPNAITMMLTADVDAPTLSVLVLDATTRVELAAIKGIPVEITI